MESTDKGNSELIRKFYESFQKLDAEGMCSCYHKDVVFSDPAFGILEGDMARNMWKMLCNNARDLKMEFSDVTETSARWQAWYTFSQTGRPVHNQIEARFTFKDGKIIRHEDRFDLHKWAKQALGFKGWLLGGTQFFKGKFQQQTHKALKKFEKKKVLV